MAVAILDAEVVWIGTDGVAPHDALYSRVNDDNAVALAFDLMALDGDDLRRKPFSESKAVLRKVLQAHPSRYSIRRTHRRRWAAKMFKAVCKLGLEGMVSKKLDAPYRSGPSKTLKIKNKKARAATRAIEGTFWFGYDWICPKPSKRSCAFGSPRTLAL